MGQIFSAESPSSNGNDVQSTYSKDAGVSNDHLFNVTNNSPSQSYIDIFPSGSNSYSGYAVIFNHKIYNPNLNLEERLGTDNDVKAITESFEMFDIFVDVKQDLTLKEIEAEVKRLRYVNFTKFNCFFVVILTHGEKKNKLWAHDWKYKLSDIIDPIVMTNETLCKKPKIFIIQACKGQDELKTFIQKDINVASLPALLVPRIMNMMFIFSTYEGYTSNRHPINGGIFIQLFCKMIKEFGKTESITNLMERVTDQLCLKNEQQVPTIISTMRESFCFGKITKQKFGYAIIYYGNELTQNNSEWNEFLTTLKMMNIKLELIRTNDIIGIKKWETFDFTKYDYLMIFNFTLYLFESDKMLILKKSKSLDGKPKIIITVERFYFYKNIIEQSNIPDLLFVYFGDSNLFNGKVSMNYSLSLKFYDELIPILTKMIKKYGKTKSIDIIMKYVDDELKKINEFQNLQLKTHSKLKEPFYF